MTAHIADLKRRFFGGGTDAQRDYYEAAAAAGRTAATVVANGLLASCTPSANTAALSMAGGAYVRFPEFTTAPFVAPEGLIVVQLPQLVATGPTDAATTWGIQYRKNGTGTWHQAWSASARSYSGGVTAVEATYCLVPNTSTTPDSRIVPGDTIEVALCVKRAAGGSVTVAMIEANGIFPFMTVTALA